MSDELLRCYHPDEPLAVVTSFDPGKDSLEKVTVMTALADGASVAHFLVCTSARSKNQKLVIATNELASDMLPHGNCMVMAEDVYQGFLDRIRATDLAVT